MQDWIKSQATSGFQAFIVHYRYSFHTCVHYIVSQSTSGFQDFIVHYRYLDLRCVHYIVSHATSGFQAFIVHYRYLIYRVCVTCQLRFPGLYRLLQVPRPTLYLPCVCHRPPQFPGLYRSLQVPSYCVSIILCHRPPQVSRPLSSTTGT